MASGEEPKPVNVYMSSEGADPITVKAVQEGIQQVLNKFKDAQGVVYVSIENLHIHPIGGPHGPPRGRRDRSRSRGKSRGHSRSRSRSGHRKGKHGKHHSRGRHGHGHGYGYGRYHYWCHSPPRSETEDTSAAEETGETSGVEASQAPPCCYRGKDKKHKKGRRHGRSRSRSRSRSKTRCDKDKHCKKDKKWKKDKCCNKKGTDAQPSETIDLTDQNQSGEKDLQEKFDSMNVKSP